MRTAISFAASSCSTVACGCQRDSDAAQAGSVMGRHRPQPSAPPLRRGATACGWKRSIASSSIAGRRGRGKVWMGVWMVLAG